MNRILTGLPTNRLTAASATSATQDFQAAVCRRRFLTIELSLHVLGDLIQLTP